MPPASHVDAFISRFYINDWRPESFSSALSDIVQELTVAFNCRAACVWVPRYHSGGQLSDADDAHIVLAFTTFDSIDIASVDQDASNTGILQTLPVGSSIHNCYTTGEISRIAFSQSNPLSGRTQQGDIPASLILKTGYDVAWCLPIEIRNLAPTGRPHVTDKVRILVTLHGVNDSVPQMPLTDELTKLRMLAQQQFERAVWEKQDALLRVTTAALHRFESARSDAFDDICRAIAKLLGFHACTLFSYDKPTSLLRVAGTTGLQSRVDRRQLALEVNGDGPSQRAASQQKMVFAESWHRSEIWSDTSDINDSPKRHHWEQVITAPIIDEQKGSCDLVGVIRLRDKLPISCAPNRGEVIHPLHCLNQFCVDRATGVLLPLMKLDREARFREETMKRIRHDQRVPATIVRDFAQRWRTKSQEWIAANYDLLVKKLEDIEGLAELMILLSDLARLSSEGTETVRLNIQARISLLTGIVVPLAKTLEDLAKKTGLSTDRPILYEASSFKAFPNLFVDPQLIKIAVYNLLDNAIKYAFKGTQVMVDGERDESKNLLLIHIGNYGIQIRPEEESDIFKPFYRSPLAEQKSFSGVGLGLSFAKTIMKLHGGDLQLTSNGTRTQFTLSFPTWLEDRKPKGAT